MGKCDGAKAVLLGDDATEEVGGLLFEILHKRRAPFFLRCSSLENLRRIQDQRMEMLERRPIVISHRKNHRSSHPVTDSIAPGHFSSRTSARSL